MCLLAWIRRSQWHPDSAVSLSHFLPFYSEYSKIEEYARHGFTCWLQRWWGWERELPQESLVW